MSYTERFNLAVGLVLEHEGGYVNDPVDRGGATAYGISLRWLRSIGSLGDVDGDGDVDWEDVKALTRDDAIRFYHEFWWAKYKYQMLPTGVDRKVFDLAVNMGPGRAHRILQQSLRELGETLAADGVIGPITRNACYRQLKWKLLNQLRTEAAQFYLALIHENPEFKKYKEGWLNRAYS